MKYKDRQKRFTECSQYLLYVMQEIIENGDGDSNYKARCIYDNLLIIFPELKPTKKKKNK